MAQYISSSVATLRRWKRRIFNWAKANPDRALSVVSIILTCFLSIIALRVSFKGNDLNMTMLALAKHQDSLSIVQTRISDIQLAISKRQDTTSIDLQHFSKLLDKTDTAIAKYSDLAYISQEQLEVNKSLQEYELHKRRSEIVNEYGGLGLALMDLNDEMLPFWNQKTGRFNTNVNLPFFEERLRLLNLLQSLMLQQKNIRTLIPNDSLVKRWEDLSNDVIALKRQYVYNLHYNYKKDTSLGGKFEFDNMMYKTQDLLMDISKVYNKFQKRVLTKMKKKFI